MRTIVKDEVIKWIILAIGVAGIIYIIFFSNPLQKIILPVLTLIYMAFFIKSLFKYLKEKEHDANKFKSLLKDGIILLVGILGSIVVWIR